jgi:hypothetical protein
LLPNLEEQLGIMKIKPIAKAGIITLEENRLRKSLEFWQVVLHLNLRNDAHKSTIMYLWYELQVFVDNKIWL